MTRTRALSEGEIAEAEVLRARNRRLWTVNKLAKRYGVAWTTMWAALDPGYLERLREQRRQSMHKLRRAKRAEGTPRQREHFEYSVDRDARNCARVSGEPLTLTGRILGDPPPGRSALDKRRMQQANL